MLKGIDVSHHQGSVDWGSLKSRYGLTWGACKAAEGVSFQDSQFPANWRKMKSAGLIRMAYYFARPGGDPASAARFFLSYVKASGLDATDILCMDLESNPNNLPMLAMRDWLATWADTVTHETGRKPFLYTGSGYIANNATKDLKPHYAAWWFPKYPSAYDGHTSWPSTIAGYPSVNNWGVPDIWQFSQSFANSYDASIANMTLDDLKTRGRGGATKPPAKPPVSPPPTEEEDIMALTEQQLADAFEQGQDQYNARLYSDKGTLGIWHAQEVAYRAAHLAALEAQTTALQNLADALKAKP